ncbi:hypothetical protein [Mycoplasma sp. 1654_15]|uniref:hypothetical protein n=1 Tax=Mycoplasma sp. 1654_15 TaxID=2725994 RepID=UPI001449E848|nr:hypothetical protein [Mycoplasma sp. 1654_15]QJB71199.1 hypothetical protein HF996_01740 [Mycoplasma sp. 1654_15]
MKNLSKIKDWIFQTIKNKLFKNALIRITHGDFYPANLLISKDLNELKFIDPRGKFAQKNSILGDLRYDFEKLLHSFNGYYDFIKFDKFTLKQRQNIYFDYEIFTNEIVKKTNSYLEKQIQKQFNLNIDDIKFIEALLFLTMIPLHYENLEHQKMFYLLAIEKFNYLMEKKWE